MFFVMKMGQQDTKGFPGVKKGGVKGEVKRGEVVESEQGLKGKEGGEMREKGRAERVPKAHSKNSDLGTPLI